MATVNVESLAPHVLVVEPSPDRVLLYQSLLRQGVVTDAQGMAALFAYLGGEPPAG